MNKAAEILEQGRKIVLKIGSAVLATPDGKLDKSKVAAVAEQALYLIKQGKQVVIVSSGAGVAGAGVLGVQNRRNDVNYKQALCAVGQVELMDAYKERFAQDGFVVGQALLTEYSFSGDTSTINFRNMLFTLLDEGVVPIINENDSVATDEISFGDNDHLAALMAILWNADALILMSDVDGVFDSSPKENSDAELVEEVRDIKALLAKIDTEGKSVFGTGGMDSKIRAAKDAGAYGIPLILVNGTKEKPLESVLSGGACTIFLPSGAKN